MSDGPPRGYAAALEYLYARTNGPFKFGLERTEALLQSLEDPHRTFPSLHIAGTNGKGSSVATAEAILRAKGLRVGKYTSPHLVDFRERVVVDGRCIGETEVVDFIAECLPRIEALGATFFEATTALAFAHFARERVDVAIVETGLGGRLDSTNVVFPVAAGVTNIGLDHMEYLGDSRERIADEKAGIFKTGRPAVIGEGDDAIAARLAERAREVGASEVVIVSERYALDNVRIDERGTSFEISNGRERAPLRTPLIGAHQAANVAFALALLDAAGAPYAASLDAAAAALPSTSIPGRFERTGAFIFDVAHNPEGASVLARTLEAVRPGAPVVALFAVLADKDWRGMLRALAPHVERFVLTNAPSAPAARAWHLEDVARYASEEGIAAEAIANFGDALDRARSLGRTVLVTGSFHTVGDAMARLQHSPLCR